MEIYHTMLQGHFGEKNSENIYWSNANVTFELYFHFICLRSVYSKESYVNVYEKEPILTGVEHVKFPYFLTLPFLTMSPAVEHSNFQDPFVLSHVNGNPGISFITCGATVALVPVRAGVTIHHGRRAIVFLVYGTLRHRLIQ